MTSRVLCGSLLAVLFATSGEAQFEIRGSRLHLDGVPFSVRGVAYSPTPIGEIASSPLRVSNCLYARDFSLMARADINTVRLYARTPVGERVFWQELERNNLYALAGFPLDPYYDPAATLAPNTDAGRALRAKILGDFRDYAAQLRDNRRVIALVFGNEVGTNYGRKFAGSPRDFYSLLEEAAGVLRASLGSSAPLLTTAIDGADDLAQASLATRDADLPDLAFWSVNALRGSSFGTLFDDLRRKTAKAVVISEFGVDAWDSVHQAEDGATQAAALRVLVGQLRNEMARAGATVAGGAWFSWSDEWWRGGDPSRHAGGANGAWFGLFGVAASDAPGLDSLRPRPAFQALADEWGGALPSEWPKAAKLNPQGVVNAASSAPTIAPGALISLYGEELAGSAAFAAGSMLPTGLDLTSACLAGRAVPLLAIDAGQVNGQAPWETATGAATALVYRAGAASNVTTVDVRDLAPGILDRGVIPSGRPCPVTVTNGVRRGTYLEIYGTGLGGVSAPLPSGIPLQAARPTDVTPRALLGPRDLRVLYSGLVPGFVGLYQTNVQVPDDFPSGAPLDLRLLSGDATSNAYPIAVIADSDQPHFSLSPDTLNFFVQAGGPPRSAELAIDGQNGFCEIVRFAVAAVPEGVNISVPVGFPGQRVPVTVQAAPQARGQDAIAQVRGVSLTPDSPAARLRITVLPSQGDIPFRVLSGGGKAGLVARFEMAGRVMLEAHGGGPGRGIHFLTLGGGTGVLGPIRSFDTWLSEKAAEDMADFLYALPPGTVVLGAIADEGTLHLTPRARAALRDVLRSQLSDALRYQDSWAIITRVGAALPIAEDRAGDRPVVLDRVLTFPMP